MVLAKPDYWESMVFSNKLRWYATRDTDMKNIFSDKLKIKYILKKMKLPKIYYAKIYTHVKPLNPQTELDIIVPIEMELEKPDLQFTKEKMNKIVSKTTRCEDFWDILREKHNIYPLNKDNTPPKSYVYKLNLGWNQMIFVINNKLCKIVDGTNNYELDSENMHIWKKNILKKYTKKIPPKFFAEEFIGYNLKVYEFYCIYGKPVILSVYYETDVSYENNYRIIYSKDNLNEMKLELLEDKHLIKDAKKLPNSINNTIVKEMCDYAKEFASYFEFVRVDFYYHKKRIYFSECTFKPGALKTIQWGDIGNILSESWTRKP